MRHLSAASLFCEHKVLKGRCPECRPRALARASDRPPLPQGRTGFYVYENWLHARVIVHHGDCPYCNHGRGMHEGASEQNGRWHKDFATREDALEFARLKSREARPCDHCGGWDRR